MRIFKIIALVFKAIQTFHTYINFKYAEKAYLLPDIKSLPGLSAFSKPL